MIRVRDSRKKRTVLLVIAGLILIPGAYGFIEKLVQFIRALSIDRGVDFTLVPVSNYLFVAAGMACIRPRNVAANPGDASPAAAGAPATASTAVVAPAGWTAMASLSKAAKVSGR